MDIKTLTKAAKAATPTDIKVRTATCKLATGSMLVCHVYEQGDTHYRIVKPSGSVGISAAEAMFLLNMREF